MSAQRYQTAGGHVCADCGGAVADARSRRCVSCYKKRRKATQKTWAERFSGMYKADPITGCWLWTGAAVRSGYGIVSERRNGRNTCKGAHRVSYELHVGAIPEDALVLHRCDRPACVNPAHLFLGTQKDNTDDCRSKDRHTRGEKHGAARLTAADVLSIRKDTRTISQIASAYGVSRTAIGLAKTGRTWKHLAIAREHPDRVKLPS